MNFTENQRNEIWRSYFNNANSGIDVFGRNVSFNNFEADHIWPSSKGGLTEVENGIPLAPLSNEEKSDLYEGTINNKRFEVLKGRVQGIGKLEVNGVIVSK